MIQIALNGGMLLLDDDDLKLLDGHKPYLGKNGYAYITIWHSGEMGSRPETVHSRILPGGGRKIHVDHVNGDKLDNRRQNLRLVSTQKNQVNRRRMSRNNSSGVRGVHRNNVSSRNPWTAQITVQGKNIYLGIYPTLEDAITVRRSAELKYFGEVCPIEA